MKTLMMTLGFLAALPIAAAAQATQEDLKKLAAAGVGDDVVLAFVRANGPAPRLSAGDVAELKKAGVSDRVLQALIGAPSEAAPAPERAVERVVERPVYAPRTYTETEPYYPVSYRYASYTPSYYYPSYSYYRPFYGGWCSPGYRYGGYYGRYGYGYGSGWGVGVGYSGGRWGVGVGYRW